MPYRSCWRLIGTGGRVLQRGELDGLHDDEYGAIQEILSQLTNFAIHGRNEERNEWWAKRTPEADMEMRFRVEPRIATTR
jgi:hypothetical protein